MAHRRCSITVRDLKHLDNKSSCITQTNMMGQRRQSFAVGDVKATCIHNLSSSATPNNTFMMGQRRQSFAVGDVKATCIHNLSSSATPNNTFMMGQRRQSFAVGDVKGMHNLSSSATPNNMMGQRRQSFAVGDVKVGDVKGMDNLSSSATPNNMMGQRRESFAVGDVKGMGNLSSGVTPINMMGQRKRSFAVPDVNSLDNLSSGIKEIKMDQRRKSIITDDVNMCDNHCSGSTVISSNSVSESNVKRARRASLSMYAPVKTAAVQSERVSEVVSMARQALNAVDKLKRADSYTGNSISLNSGTPHSKDEQRGKTKLPSAWFEYLEKINTFDLSSKKGKVESERQISAEKHEQNMDSQAIAERRSSDTDLYALKKCNVDVANMDATTSTVRRLSLDLNGKRRMSNTSSFWPIASLTRTYPNPKQYNTYSRYNDTLPPIASTESDNQEGQFSKPPSPDQQSENIHVQKALTSHCDHQVHLPHVNVSQSNEEQHIGAASHFLPETAMHEQTDGSVCSFEDNRESSTVSKRGTNSDSRFPIGRDKSPVKTKKDACCTNAAVGLKANSCCGSGYKGGGGRLTDERIKIRHDHTLKLRKLLANLEEEMPTQARLKLQKLREEQNLN